MVFSRTFVEHFSFRCFLRVVSVGLPVTAFVGYVMMLFDVSQENNRRGICYQEGPTTPIFSQTAMKTTTLCEHNNMKRFEELPSDITTELSIFDISNNTSRARRTINLAETYYSQHSILPRPTIMHSILPHSSDSTSRNENDDNKDNNNKERILVIGDIHGCYDELLLLYEKAVMEYNNGQPFTYVISVGDLVNKGPKSVDVVRHFRTTPNWLAIRGNHDDGALKAVLGDPEQRKKKKYHWITNLSDDDVEWMLDLPYTIRIPNNDNYDLDTLIVHAGLVPGKDLDDQTIGTMITLREVDVVENDKESSEIMYAASINKNLKDNNNVLVERYPWASVWNGPYRVIFGHDARRGLQRYNNINNMDDSAIGLDTGCCYGKKLTAVILPERRLVQVDALEIHCPVD